MSDLKQTDLERLLSPGHVVVTLSAEVADKPQAQLTFSFAVNVLARLYPVVQRLDIVLPGDVPLLANLPRWRRPGLADHVGAFLEALRPDTAYNLNSPVQAAPTCRLAIGTSDLSVPTVFVGADGWEARVSSEGPVGTGEKVNPVGAYAAACLGVAEVWKLLVLGHGHLLRSVHVSPLEGSLTFSAFTYRVGGDETNPSLPDAIQIGRVSMIGLGAGGGTSAFTLASLHQAFGAVKAVDPDEVIDPNLNRYVFADLSDATTRRPKVEVVKALFRPDQTRITVEPIPLSYEQALRSLSQADFEYVLAAVHSRAARRQLQYETPKVLWDGAAGEDGEFRIWRMILGRTECMHCKHPVRAVDSEVAKAKQLDSLLGVGADSWLRKLRDNEAFSDEEATLLTERIRINSGGVEPPVAGQRYSDWEAVNCGQLKLPEGDDEIPIPFAPVMAGVLLAGEVIKQHHFPEAVLDSYYWNTLMGKFMTRTSPARRQPRITCSFCKDPDYVMQYKRRWERE